MTPEKTQANKARLADLLASNLAFSKKLPGLQIAWDTVSTGALKTCPRYYSYSVIEGWMPNQKSVHLDFGLALHTCSEKYHEALAEGGDHNDGVRQALLYALTFKGTTKEVKKCLDCKTIAVALNSPHCLHCNTGLIDPENFILEELYHPWDSGDSNKNRRNLCRTAVWYFDFWKDSSVKTIILADGSPAVELWFRYETDEVTQKTGEKFILTGHIDRLVEYLDNIWFLDLKTTKNQVNENFFKKFKPDNQMSFYTVAGKVVFKVPIKGAIIDGMQVAVGFTDFRRDTMEMTDDLCEEYLFDLFLLLHRAEEYAEMSYWPMNDKSCHDFGGCQYLDVCTAPHSARELILKSHFKRREWDPLKERNQGS